MQVASCKLLQGEISVSRTYFYSIFGRLCCAQKAFGTESEYGHADKTLSQILSTTHVQMQTTFSKG